MGDITDELKNAQGGNERPNNKADKVQLCYKLIKLPSVNIILGNVGRGKCVAEDNLVVQSNGIRIKIKDVPKSVVSLNTDYKLVANEIVQFHDTGLKPVFKLTTASGRSITVAKEHQFLKFLEFTELQNLNVGDFIAVPRTLPFFGNGNLENYKIITLAYLISEGALGRNTPTFTNKNQVLVNEFRNAVEQFPNTQVKYDNDCGYYVVQKHKQYGKLPDLSSDCDIVESYLKGYSTNEIAVVKSVSGHTIWERLKKVGVLRSKDNSIRNFVARGNQNSVTNYLESLGLMGTRSGDKFIPDIIFTLPKSKIALFLSRLFAGDGSSAKGDGALEYTSKSPILAENVQHLLLRFGIITYLHYRIIGGVKYYRVMTSDFESIQRFWAEIGIFGKSLKLKMRTADTDVIPKDIWRIVEKEKGNITWADIGRLLGTYSFPKSACGLKKTNCRRATLLRIAKILNSDTLRILAESDIYWDKVKSIEPIGMMQTRDLTCKNFPNYIVSDFITHNSGLAYELLDKLSVEYNLLPVVVNLPSQKRSLLPENWVIKDIEGLKHTENCIALIDEGTTTLPAGAKVEEMVKSLSSLSRQRNQIIVMIFHSGRDVGSRILRGIYGAILLKEPSTRQIQYGSKDKWMKDMLTEAKTKFKSLQDLGEETRAWTWVDSEDPEFQGMAYNDLPNFWSSELSKAWAGVDTDNQMVVTQEPKQQGMSLIDIFKARDTDNETIDEYFDKMGVPQDTALRELICKLDGEYTLEELHRICKEQGLSVSHDKHKSVWLLMQSGYFRENKINGGDNV